MKTQLNRATRKTLRRRQFERDVQKQAFRVPTLVGKLPCTIDACNLPSQFPTKVGTLNACFPREYFVAFPHSQVKGDCELPSIKRRGQSRLDDYGERPARWRSPDRAECLSMLSEKRKNIFRLAGNGEL
jgi:hypothetical protein